MYDYVRGRIAARDGNGVVLEANGVGYRLVVSRSTFARVPADGECRLYAHLLVRDEQPELFGFATREERHLFRRLLQVGGVGPAVAMGLLSAHEPEALASLIAGGDAPALTRVKGVGRRTAERIVVELRDRFRAETGAAGRAPSPAPPAGGVRDDAVRALQALGLTRAEADERVAAVAKDGMALEEIVRMALR